MSSYSIDDRNNPDSSGDSGLLANFRSVLAGNKSPAHNSTINPFNPFKDNNNIAEEGKVPSVIYFRPKNMDRSLGGVYWKLDKPINKDTLCETFVHEGTKDEFSHTRDNRTIDRLQIELKSVFENYRLGILDSRREFEEALKKRCEALSIDMNYECPGHFYWISDHYPAVEDQYWKVKSVDENTLNELKRINRKLIKDNSHWCLIYTTNDGDSKDDTSIDSRTQLIPSSAEKAGTGPSHMDSEGIKPPSVKFFIDYDHGIDDVRQTRAALNEMAEQIYSSGSLDMGLMNALARLNKLSTHQTTQDVLDSLVSCEPWIPQTEAESNAHGMSEK